MRDRQSVTRGAGPAADGCSALDDAEVSTTVADSSRAPSEESLQIVVLRSTGLTIYPLPAKGVLSIGRGEDCEVRVADALASRKHARLHVSPLAIEDTGSVNGTRVGARRLAAGVLEPLQLGQALRIGGSLLIVRRSQTLPSTTGERPVSRARLTPSDTKVVCDPAMLKLYTLVQRLAKGQISVLILGETGVGKEVVAEALHRDSPRAHAPLLRINCAALSEALLESELFGHERGAFTGAVVAKPGLIELASGGTVFLDEVGELSPALQAKLLRLIETREALRVGGVRAQLVDVRFLFATNRNLETDVARGKFRSDLFFRLSGAVIDVPALRERRAEIIPLARAFLTRAAEQLQLSCTPSLSHGAEQRLLTHGWPGNVRELRNVIEHAALLCTGDTIRAEELALDAASDTLELLGTGSETPGQNPSASERERERERITQALSACGGNQSRAAASLGMARRTLVRRIAQLGLPRPRRGD